VHAVVDRARIHAPVLTSVAISTVWTVLAIRNPTSTYHFAPLLTAAAWPVVARSTWGPRSVGEAARASVGGLVIVLFMVAELNVLDALRGPAFFGLDATGETLVFGFVGAVVGGIWSALPSMADVGNRSC
jgi:hypothetical protein